MRHLRRAWLAALVCFVAVLGVAPTAALAAKPAASPVTASDVYGNTYEAYRVEKGELYVAGVKMPNEGDVCYYVTDGFGGITQEGASAEKYGVSWDPATGVLTLKDVSLTKTAWTDHRVDYVSQTYPQDFSTDAVILARRDVTIRVMGKNVLTNLRECPGANYTGLHRHGIAAFNCDVTIVGGGAGTSSLAVEASEHVTISSGSKQDWMNSIGVNVLDGTLTVRDITLTATGHDTTYCSMGIYVDGSATFENSVVTATAKEAMPASGAVANNWTSSYGMYVGPYSDGTGGMLTVDNTELTASSGVSYASVGLCVASVEVTGSSVVEASTETGDGTNVSQSFALYCGDYTIDGGRVVANAGPAKGVSFTYGGETYDAPGYSVGYEGVYNDEDDPSIYEFYGMNVVKGSVELTSGEASADGYSVAYEGPTQDFSASDYHATVSYNADATAEGAEAWTPECDGADQGNGYVLLTGNKYFAVDSSFSPSVSVTWDDLDDLDGIRPDELELCFMSGDEAAGRVTVTPDADGVWAATLDAALPVYNAQLTGDYRAADAWEKIPYTVEVTAPEGYSAPRVSGDAHSEGGLLVTLLHDVSHDVTFVSGVPGAKDEVQTVAHGELAVRPTDPTYEGWTFLGWYTDDTFSTPYDFETPVTADVTLYGGWVEAGEEPGEPADPGEPGAADGTDEAGLPSTGDPASLAAVLTAAAGALALAASRRR